MRLLRVELRYPRCAHERKSLIRRRPPGKAAIRVTPAAHRDFSWHRARGGCHRAAAGGSCSMRLTVTTAATATVLSLACVTTPPALAAPVGVVTDDPSARPWVLSMVGIGGGDVVLSRLYGGYDWTRLGSPVKVPLTGGAAAEIPLEPGAGIQAVAGNDAVYSVPPFGNPRW